MFQGQIHIQGQINVKVTLIFKAMTFKYMELKITFIN